MDSISGTAPSDRRSMVSSTAWRKRHSTEGWMAVHFSLMTACTRDSSSSRLRRMAMENSGSTSRSLRVVKAIEVARVRGGRSPGGR